MTEPYETPKKESHVLCKECSKEAGEGVLYHKKLLKKVDPFWGGEAYWECPEGHKVDYTEFHPVPA